jgi:hypothetical protein
MIAEPLDSTLNRFNRTCRVCEPDRPAYEEPETEKAGSGVRRQTNLMAMVLTP